MLGHVIAATQPKTTPIDELLALLPFTQRVTSLHTAALASLPEKSNLIKASL